jgi:hypothetical protein
MQSLNQEEFSKHLWTHFVSTIEMINSSLQAMNGTWLEGFGLVFCEKLKVGSYAEFFEVFPVVHKIIGEDLKKIIGKEDLKSVIASLLVRLESIYVLSSVRRRLT